MVDHFYVSKDTIRRDFSILAKEKNEQEELMEVYCQFKSKGFLIFKVEQKQFSKEKEKIAHLATQLISDSQLIFSDVSTTILELAKL